MSAASADHLSGLTGPQARARRHLSLRWRLVLLVVAGVVPLLAFSLGYQYLEYRNKVDTTGRQTLALARSMALLVEEELRTRIAALQTLTVSRPLQAGDFDGFRAQAETVVAQQFSGTNIVLLKEDGRQFMNTIVPAGTPLPFRPNVQSTRRVFATGRPAVSNLYEAAIGSRSVVAIDVPVKGPDGAVTYALSLVLALNPRLQVFNDVIRRQQLPATWVVSVFDRHGVNIARVPNGDRFVGHKASPSLLDALRGAREGILQTTSLEGVPLLTVFSHTEPFGWAVAIGVPRAELTGPALSAALRTLAIGAVLLAFSLLLALYAARRIAGPIEALRRLAATDGDAFLDPPDTGLRETDEVVEALRSTEENRKRSERTAAIFRDGIETMPAGFVIFDDQDRLVICNQSYRDLSPDTPDLIVPGARFEDIARAGLAMGRFPDAHGREEEWLAEQLRVQRELHGTLELRLQDGRSLFVTKSRLANGYGAALVIDITPLKTAEAALSRSEEQLRRAQRLAQMGSDIRNLRTDEAEWSDETYRIFGVSRESFVPSTENFLQTVHPEDRVRVLAARELVRQGLCPPPFEYRIALPDGAVRQIYRENELLRDEAGEPLYLVGTIHDVTERRNIEHQLRQAQKMEAIGNLTGGMAHDFNNLLGIIVGNLDLARERTGNDAELSEIVGEALDAALRGADLTRRLLAFARRQPLRPARIEVNELVADTVRLLRRLLGEDIEISLDLAEAIWPVTADPAQLEASLANLATNARDAMPNGGRLIVTTANRHLDADYAATHADVAEGAYVMIEVSDTGTGMSPEIISRVFEPFFTTKEPGKGTGLGLSMVFGFLRQSGGHVNVYSEPGVGTTFRLYLPRPTAEALPREVAEARPVEPAAGETVLVVEDNPAVRRIVLRQLREFGYRVFECDRAAAALELLQREPIDLLLTDIVMPGGLDGVALARLAVERWPALKIVLTSGFPQARIDGDGEVLGTSQLLSKPYRKDDLAAALRAALSG